jgi:hypothetical protein
MLTFLSPCVSCLRFGRAKGNAEDLEKARGERIDGEGETYQRRPVRGLTLPSLCSRLSCDEYGRGCWPRRFGWEWMPFLRGLG